MAAKKTTKSKKTKKQIEAELSTKRQLSAIIFFALGIIFTAMTFVTGEHLWETMHYALFGLCGWCAYLIGPVFIYLAVMNTLERPTFSTDAQGWESLALLLLLSGITTVFSKSVVLEGGFFAQIGQLYTYGKELQGGGVLSMVFGVSSVALMGRTAAIIVGIVAIIVVIMLLTGTTLIGFAKDTKKAGEKIKEVYVEQVEQRKAVEASRRDVVIDIPLDDEPVKYQKKETGDAVRRSKEKLLGAAGKDGRSDFVVPDVPDEPIPVTTMQTIPAETEEKKEPISGFNAVPLEEKEIASAPKKPMEVQIDIPLDDIKSADEQMAEAAKDPKLEELISKAAEKPMKNLTSKEKMQAIADEEQRKITEIMDDLETIPYVFPSVGLLKEAQNPDPDNISEELRKKADTIMNTLQSFGVQAKVVNICRGPAVTRYELQPGAGVKVSKIANLSDDLALALAARGVRIEAPIPGKPAVGIEVPNKIRSIVSIREVLDSDEFRSAKSKLTVALGRDIVGNIVLADLAAMPHLLVAGSTGSGKSVCINTMIMSILYKANPDEVKLLLIDPKVVELGVYNGIPHLLIPVVTDPKKAAGALNWAVSEMLKRYQIFADNGVRDVKGYNELAEEREDLRPMPKVVIIIDELADLMMVASSDVENAINRLAALARAAGMHLVVATQRPSVDVITGVIKSNIGSRIAFKASSQIDSRTILNDGGAEKLLGKGDMLYHPQSESSPARVQGCYVSDHEVEKVVKFVKDGGTAEYDEEILDDIERLAAKDKNKNAPENEGGGFEEEDEMLPAAIECVIEMGQASTSMLQRKLKLGYARAARIIDQMEERGIVGPFEGSKPRQVLITKEQWLEKQLQSDD